MKTKPGYKTTEFWMTVLTVLGTWGGAIQDYVPPKFAAITSAATISAYAIARGIRKSQTQSSDVAVIQNNTTTKKKPRKVKAVTEGKRSGKA